MKIDVTPPAWIDQEIWLGFVEMRLLKGKRAPFTSRAAKMIIAELDRLRGQGHNPDEVLKQSLIHGWSGVFPLRHLASPVVSRGLGNQRSRSFAEIDAANRADQIYQMTGGLMGRAQDTLEMEVRHDPKLLD